ncbi:MAG TPA: polysaccharide deacetylase family protein [Flavobacteriales bacterium]|jgi:peptidoglycan/xylan/chitin deacetylase (PgdA/CDA1 family)|nr:polysaccharide deacetylase family protein [Flavobacteriales bacterium]
MKYYRTPDFIQRIYSSYYWRIPTNEREVFITFDDGPVPGVTPHVLDILDHFGAKATFFEVGENVAKYPGIHELILHKGHHVGNHTQNHLKGWNTPTFKYTKNALECRNYVQSSLFRPPYGKMTRLQAKSLKSKFNIIMWDLLSMDYSPSFDAEESFSSIRKYWRPGSIIVFHDSLKAQANVISLLAKVLEWMKAEGIQSSPIPYELNSR